MDINKNHIKTWTDKLDNQKYIIDLMIRLLNTVGHTGHLRDVSRVIAEHNHKMETIAKEIIDHSITVDQNNDVRLA